jgi:hypothetical protein
VIDQTQDGELDMTPDEAISDNYGDIDTLKEALSN